MSSIRNPRYTEIANDFSAILDVIATLETKYQDNSPVSSHIRAYAGSLRESIEVTSRDICAEKLLWSDLHIAHRLMRGYKIGSTGLNISAYPIKYKQEALLYPGYWCHCESDNRYYIAVNGAVHGGTFLNVMHNDNVFKFNEHSFAKTTDYRSTGLYIPPEVNSTSKDVRNLPQALEYVPAAEKTTKKHIVRVGDARNLKNDIHNLNEQDYRVFSDITMNNLLGLTVATKEKHK